MSFQANLSDALAAAPLARERRPAAAEQAVSAERRDNAWQREMERAQAGAWFPGALPEGEGLFRNRPDVLPAHPASPSVPRSAGAPHAVHAAQPSKPDAAPSRAEEREDRIETRAEGTAFHQQERAMHASPAQASSQPVAHSPEDAPPPAHETSDLAPAAAAASVASGVEGLSTSDAAVPAATANVAAAQAASAAASGAPGQHGPAVWAAPPSAPTVQTAGPAPGAAVSMRATGSTAIQSSASAAPPAQPAVQASRAVAALPVAPAGVFPAASLPAAAEGAAPLAQEGSGESGAAPGVRTLASIERVLAATLGGSPGPRLHLSWDGQAVAVWLGVDGAVDLAALLRTVQNVLRQQGLQLSSLICNGRTIVLPRPAQAQQSNSEHQEN
jgi:hypothetical protein